MNNKLSAYEIKNAIDPCCTLGDDLRIFDTLESTNDYAKLIGGTGAPHGCTIIANHQTAGKGRFGRSFFSPSDTGIYMSVILNSDSIHDAALLTPMAAVAVARSIESVATINAQIKWVNDIYIGGRKVCGILAEAKSPNSSSGFYAIGIGVNVSTNSFPNELCDIAFTLSEYHISRNLLIGRILSRLDELIKDPNIDAVMEEYKCRSCVIGKRIQVLDKQPFTALAIDIDRAGRLIVSDDNGTIHTLNSGEISIKNI